MKFYFYTTLLVSIVLCSCSTTPIDEFKEVKKINHNRIIDLEDKNILNVYSAVLTNDYFVL